MGVCVRACVVVCGTLEGTPNDGWQGILWEPREPRQPEKCHYLIIQPSTKSGVPCLINDSFILAHSLSPHSHFCPSFYSSSHYFFTSPLSIKNAVLKSFKVYLSSSSSSLELWENCLGVINSTHLTVWSRLKQDWSDNNVWPRCGVCPIFRCEWMWEEQWRLCRGVCEHQGLQAVWVWAGPCDGQGWTQLQRYTCVRIFIWQSSQCCEDSIKPWDDRVGFIFSFSLCGLLQRWQAAMSTMAAAVTAAPRCWTPINATVPEDWSWERINTHVRVCTSVC